MSSNSFGTLFRITTWGESHGKAIGVVLDGCPAGLEINEEDINVELARRAPGKNPFVTPRAEKDRAEIYSGVFEGKTTGAPISIIIFNHDSDSAKYEAIKNQLRPGHANFTYLKKYGLFDYRGGGRASARETACRVAAGAVAKKLLKHFSIQVVAFLNSVLDVNLDPFPQGQELSSLQKFIHASPIFCPDTEKEKQMMQKIEEAKRAGDSLGGSVAFLTGGLPAGFGDPIYEKLEAKLASAMMSLPASKGFEIGEGFQASRMTGLTHNDLFTKAKRDQKNHELPPKYAFSGTDSFLTMASNHAGGYLVAFQQGCRFAGKSLSSRHRALSFRKGASTLKEMKLFFNYPKDRDMILVLPSVLSLWWRQCWRLSWLMPCCLIGARRYEIFRGPTSTSLSYLSWGWFV